MYFQDNNLVRLAMKRAEIAPYRNLIATGDNFTAGVCSDGRVLFTGGDDNGLCNVRGWKGIKAVAAGGGFTMPAHIVGLKTNGTVVAVGDNSCGQCNTSTWRNIIAISASDLTTIGLCADGTIMTAGNVFDEEELELWFDMSKVIAGSMFVVGIKNDKSIAISNNGISMMQYNNLDLSLWFDDDIVSIDTRPIAQEIIGLHEDGSVTGISKNDFCQANTFGWSDIIDIAAGEQYTLGLDLDGMVIATGDNSDGQCNVYDWSNIVAIFADFAHSVAIRSDGKVLTTGRNYDGQCNTYGWKLF